MKLSRVRKNAARHGVKVPKRGPVPSRKQKQELPRRVYAVEGHDWKVAVNSGAMGKVVAYGPIRGFLKQWDVSQLPPPQLEVQGFPTFNEAWAWVEAGEYHALQAAYALGWRPPEPDEWVEEGRRAALVPFYRLRFEDLKAETAITSPDSE